MADVIRMPRMSDTMEEGVIVGWLKSVGDNVEPGDVLAEVETDKATMELECYQEGVLLHIGIKEGAVPVNGILAVIGEEGEDYKAALAAAEKNGADQSKEEETEKKTEKKEASVSQSEDTPAPKKEAEPALAISNTPTTSDATSNRIKASPLAKKIASDSGLNLSNINGSGDNGRIVKKDVEAYLKNPPTQPTKSGTATKADTIDDKPVVAPFVYGSNGQQSEEVPVSQMRKVIAKRLGESKFSAPHFYLTIEVEMSKAIATRKQLNEIAPTRISFNDLVVKSCAVALRQHPAVNSSWLGDKIRINSEINVGVAVAVTDGLLVPVIRHADMKSLSQINVEVRELAGKAKEKRLQPDQMQGNTFTISNLGMFDIDEFTAIINPPDACIMAVGSIAEKPIVKDGELAVGNVMKLTLSCDHRVVDGATGAKFLQTVKSLLEDPVRMLV